ncbi:MAG: hypothetical protein U0325_12065 [Polyangiales bacterium]
MAGASLQRPRMRPRFEVELDVAPESVLASLRRHIAEPEAPVGGTILRRQAELCIPRRRAHFWSPCLSLELAEGDGPPRLRGRFSPEPGVWMLFVGIYGILAMFGVAGLMYGLSQWMVNETPWALAGAPVSLALIAFTYGAAIIGQGLGAEEMYTLRSFVDRAVDAAREASRPVDDAQG